MGCLREVTDYSAEMNVRQLDRSRLDTGTEWEEKGIPMVSVDSRGKKCQPAPASGMLGSGAD